MTVLQNRVDQHELNAMESRRQSEAGVYPKYEIEAKQEVANADLVYAMVKILQEYRKQTAPLEIVQFESGPKAASTY